MRDWRCICYPWHLSVVVHENSALVVEGSSTGAQGHSRTADGGLLQGSYPCGLTCIVSALSYSYVEGSSTGEKMCTALQTYSHRRLSVAPQAHYRDVILCSILVIHPSCIINLAKCTSEAKMLMKKGRHRAGRLLDLSDSLATSVLHFISLAVLSLSLHACISSIACPLSTYHGPLDDMM
jgi:hypothetical protein